MKKVPENMQGIFWSTPIEELDTNKHKTYIIHQVLMYGDFEHLRWLFTIYSKEEIKRVFVQKPQKIYTEPAVNYVSKYILELDDPPSFSKYVNTLH